MPSTWMWKTGSKLSALGDQLSTGRFGAPSCIQDCGKRSWELQFEVNNQMYFLNFVEDEGRWYVFRPSGSGVIRIPVAMEATHSEHFAFSPEEAKKRVVH